MTNDQKDECRRLARDTNYSVEAIARVVGCAKATAAKSIRIWRTKSKKRKSTT